MKSKHLLLALLLLYPILFSSCSLLVDLRPSKDDTEGVRDWLEIPVFYCTNRKESVTYEGIEYLEEPSNKGLLFGVKNVVAPRPTKMTVESSTIEDMGWHSIVIPESEAEPVKPEPMPNPKIPDKKMTGDEIVSAVRDYMESSGKKEIVIFVHGCCATFDTSMERAAKVAAHMQVPVVLYDWVSPKGFSRYLENETLLEQTQDGFFEFLDDVEKLFPERPITLIGHSMGAQFLNCALLRRYERYACQGEMPRYKEIVFASADVDALSYIRHAKQVVANGKITRIYINQEDGRLDASAFAHGGFSRLGAPGDLLPELCTTPGQVVIDDTALEPGHEMPFSLVANMHRFGTPGNEGEFELIPKRKNLFVFEKLTTDAEEQSRHH